MTKEEKGRIEWIDICKAIAVYFMVLGHVGVSKSVNIFIHSFHMPIFFIMSGFCYNEMKYKKIGDLVRTRLMSLIVPYMIFGTGLFIFWNLSLFILNRKQEMMGIRSLLSNMLWVNTNAGIFGVIQWFLTCLFICEILFWCLCKTQKNKVGNIAIGLLIIAVAACLYPVAFPYRLPWAADSALSATVFYGIGWIMKRADFGKIYTYVEMLKLKSVIAMVILFSIGTPLVFFNGEVNMRNIKYQNGILFYINALILSLSFILLAMIVNNCFKGKIINEFLVLAGRNTLVVLLLNSTVIRIWEVIVGNKVNALFGKGIYWVNIIIAILVVIICVLASMAMNKYTPFLLGKKFIGKMH